MMDRMIIKNWQEYLREAKKLINKTNFVYISTYGCYLNISSTGVDTTEWGSKYTNGCREIIDSINDRATIKMVVGINDFECSPGCPQCSSNYKKKIAYLQYSKKLLPRLNLKVTKRHHLKLFMTKNGAITGGMNFTESNWTDMSLLLSSKSAEFLQIKNCFEWIYKGTKSII